MWEVVMYIAQPPWQFFLNVAWAATREIRILLVYLSLIYLFLFLFLALTLNLF